MQRTYTQTCCCKIMMYARDPLCADGPTIALHLLILQNNYNYIKIIALCEGASPF